MSGWKAQPHGDGICWNLVSPEGVTHVIGDSPWFSHGERAAAKYLSFKAAQAVAVYTVVERDEERGDDRILDVFWTREKAEQFVKERQTPCWVEEHYRDAF